MHRMNYMNFSKLKKMYEDVIYVSRITKVKNKKLRIILTVVLANLVAAVDIGLILVFSAVIADSFQSDNILSFLVDIFLNNKFLIPVLVIFRFIFVYGQTINMKSLELEIHKNLRVHLLKFLIKVIIQFLMLIFMLMNSQAT